MELRATLLENHARNARNVRARAPHPNLARNSPRSVFNTAHKRCNSNDHILKFERFTWKLRATLLGNHARNARNARTRARTRDAATSAHQWAAPRPLAAPRTTRPTHNPPHAHWPPHAQPAPRTTRPTHTARPTPTARATHTAHAHRAPASSHGDMGRGRGQVRD